MSTSVQESAILMSLKALYKDADENNLWFYHQSSGEGEVWCSPQYLRLKQSKGELIWGPEHWELRNPKGYLNNLKHNAESMVDEYNRMAERMKMETRLKIDQIH
ncbi:hypothetical protein [Kiloniella sp.]|uniref:hypothetical protein n=1 Tax=Kiloniella sp. TaxID=1938587 RepID=UPI003B02C630